MVAVSSSDSGVAAETAGSTRVSTAAVEVAVKQATAISRVTVGVVETAIRTTAGATPQVGHSDSAKATEGWIIGYSVADSGTVVEAASAVIFLALSAGDTATGDDSNAFPILPFSDTDTGSTTSTESIAAQVTTVENGSFVDGPSIQGTVASSDAGSAAETAQELITLAVAPSDSGAAVETQLSTGFLAITSTDAGTFAEVVGGLRISATEVSTAVETGAANAQVAATDSGSEVLGVRISLSAADVAVGVDHESRIIILDGGISAGRTQAANSNSYLLVARDVTAALPRIRNVAATTSPVAIKDVQAQPSRTYHVTAAGNMVTTLETSLQLSRLNTVAVTTDTSDVTPPEPPTMVLVSQSSGIAYAGSFVIVSVGLGEPGDHVSFTWDSSATVVQTGFLDEAGNLVGISVSVPITLFAGTHHLHVSGDTFGMAILDFQVASDVPAPQADTSTSTLPPPPPELDGWHLFDPYTQETWLLPIGPSQIDAPYLTRAMTVQGTTSPLGQQVVWEGGRRASVWSASGRLVDGDQIARFRDWGARPYRVWLRDPLARNWLIKIQGVELKPVRDLAHPMTHDWTLRALIYGRKS